MHSVAAKSLPSSPGGPLRNPCWSAWINSLVYWCAEHFNVAIPTNGNRRGVTYTESASERFETNLGHFVNIADPAINDGSNTSKRSMDVGVDFTPSGSVGPGLIKILNNDYFRA